MLDVELETRLLAWIVCTGLDDYGTRHACVNNEAIYRACEINVIVVMDE